MVLEVFSNLKNSTVLFILSCIEVTWGTSLKAQKGFLQKVEFNCHLHFQEKKEGESGVGKKEEEPIKPEYCMVQIQAK